MVDKDELAEMTKEGLRRLGKAVVVITSQFEGQRYAMAATAVSELSMDPPSLLICVNKSASIHPVLDAKANFCINILSSAQERLSRLCSGESKGEARFSEGHWKDASNGAPRLVDAQACFVCTNSDSFEFGTHSVFVGLIETVHVFGDVDPLIYLSGNYTRAVLGLESKSDLD